MKKKFIASCIAAMFAFAPVVPALAISNDTPSLSQTAEMTQSEWEQELIRRDAELALDPINNAIIAQNELELEEFLAQQSLINARSVSIRTLNIQAMQQEENHWCGPATAQQLLRFFNGTAPTQQSLANDLPTGGNGSDVHDVGRMMNTRASTSYALVTGNHTISAWADRIRFSIHRGQPAILTIQTNGIAAFPYNSNGHILNVSGYEMPSAGVTPGNASISWVRVTDPINIAAGFGNRWYTASDLHRAHVTSRVAPFQGRATW